MRKILCLLLLAVLMLAGCAILPEEKEPIEQQDQTQNQQEQQQQQKQQTEIGDTYSPEDGFTETFTDIFGSSSLIYFVQYESFGLIFDTDFRPVLEINKDGTFRFRIDNVENTCYLYGTYKINGESVIFTFTETQNWNWNESNGEFEFGFKRDISGEFEAKYNQGIFTINSIALISNGYVYDVLGITREGDKIYFVSEKPEYFV